jgi:hypothetical protein
MLFICITSFLAIGMAIGYYSCLRVYRSKNKVVLPLETFEYLVERDLELLKTENKNGGMRPRAVPGLKVAENGLEVDKPVLFVI